MLSKIPAIPFTGNKASGLRFCHSCYGLVESANDCTCSVCGVEFGQRTALVRRIVAPALLALFTVGVNASDCPQLYLAEREPEITAPLEGDFYELCGSEHAVMLSAQNRTAIYSVEKLTPRQIKGAFEISRGDHEFYEDYRLPEEVRVSSFIYKHSGLDRAHLAPAGDFSTQATQRESFALSNVVPMTPEVNRGIWSDIEQTVRYMAKKGVVNVVTGPIYLGEVKTLPGTMVPIPTAIFKAVYSPGANSVGVYLVANGTDQSVAKLSLAEFTKLSALDVFPGLPDEIKQIKGALPDPIIR